MPTTEPTPGRPDGLVFSHVDVILAGNPPVRVFERGYDTVIVTVGHGPGVVTLHGPRAALLGVARSLADQLGGAR